MKYQLFIILFSISCNYSISQQKEIDSLFLELKKANGIEETSQIHTLLAVNYLNSRNYKQFNFHLSILDSLSNITQNHRIKGVNYKLKSIKYHLSKKYQESVNEAQFAIDEFVQVDDTIQIGKSVNSAVKSYLKLNNPEKALDIYENYKLKIINKRKYLIVMEVARKFIALDDFDKTVELLEQSMRFAILSSDKQKIGKVHYRFAQLYNDIKNYKDAEISGKLSLKTLDPLQNNKLYGASFFTLGQTYSHQKKYEESIRVLDSAANYYRKEKRTESSIAKILSKKSSNYFQLKKFDSANFSIRQAIKIHNKLENERPLAFAYQRLGNLLWYSQKQKDSSVYYLKEALRIAHEYKIKTAIKTSHYNLSSIYNEQEEFKKAFTHLKNAYRYSDTLYTETVAKKIKEIDTKYKSQLKENKILEQENLIQKQHLRNTKLFLYLSIALSLMIIFPLVIYHYYKSKKQQQEVILQNQSRNIQSLERKIDSLLNKYQEMSSKLQVSFDIFLKKKYGITDKMFDFWKLWAHGYSENEIAVELGMMGSGVVERRKGLYRNINHKIKNFKFNKKESVSLYYNEITNFYQSLIDEISAFSQKKT